MVLDELVGRLDGWIMFCRSSVDFGSDDYLLLGWVGQ